MIEYDRETLQQINESVNLLEYVSGDFDLERRGRDYYAHCPLHEDKTPSLAFIPSKNMYYCHSCGVGGQIISFLQDIEQLSYQEAVEKASKLAKMDLSKICKSETIKWLKSVRAERKILQNTEKKAVRGILPETVFDKYSKEYPQLWLDEGITKEAMDTFQVMVDHSSGRIIYPVRDNDGNLINIKGRTTNPLYKELKIPKYISYEKVGKIDYFQGLYETRKYAKEKKEIIIFESIKSVMKCYSWGYKNCASMESHGMTKEQMKILISLGVNVVFAFDSDVDLKAKENKKLRAEIRKLKSFTNVSLIVDRENLLGGKEAKNSPADCGKEVFERLYSSKVSWEDYDGR